MRPATVTFAFAAIVGAVGCASILSIPDRTTHWCARTGNAHAFCDDFDHANPTSAWDLNNASQGAALNFEPSDDSPPYAVSLATDPLPPGGQALAGLLKEFPDQTFHHVHVELDIKFVSLELVQDGNFATGLGFLLVESSPKSAAPLCIGTLITPQGFGIVLVPNSVDCSSVNPSVVDTDAAAPDEGGTGPGFPLPTIVARYPFLNKWLHLTLDVKRNPDGSGTIQFNVPEPGGAAPPVIPAGTLADNGLPLIAIATSVTGPAGHIALQFDNVTVDFPSD